MTKENRVLIEIGDIEGFEVECPRCEGRNYVPLRKYESLNALCINCREQFFATQGSDDHILVSDTLKLIRRFSEMTPKPKMKIRLLLKPEAKGNDNG